MLRTMTADTRKRCCRTSFASPDALAGKKICASPSPPAVCCAGRGNLPRPGAPGPRGASKGHIVRPCGLHNRRNPSESGRLGHGFHSGIQPCFRRLAQQGFCGKDTVRQPNFGPLRLCPCDRQRTTGDAKFGRGGCGLVESIFPLGKIRFSAMRVCKFFL